MVGFVFFFAIALSGVQGSSNENTGLYVDGGGQCGAVSMSTEVVIIGTVAQTTLSITFENTLGHAVQQTEFRFPLEDGQSVTSFKAVIDGERTVGGVIMARDHAKATYDAAVASNDKAFLARKSTADMFRVDVGNIGPRSRVVVTLGVVGALGMDGDAVRYRIPMRVVPRYTPGPLSMSQKDVEEHARDQSGSDQRAHSVVKIKIQAKVKLGSPITAVRSVTHHITSTKDGDGWTNVALAGPGGEIEGMSQDFVLLVDSERPKTATVVTEVGENGHHYAALLSFIPTFQAQVNKNVQHEVIFVVDRSGSMQGVNIDLARSALQLFLRSLPEHCTFDIISFGSRFTSLFDGKSLPYDESTMAQASQLVSSMEANYGGTEILQVVQNLATRPAPPPLININKPEDREEKSGLSRLWDWITGSSEDESAPVPPQNQRTVIVLTDGMVENTHQVIDTVGANVKAAHGHERWFALGLGYGASAELVNGIAGAGNGFGELVVNPSEVSAKVLRQLRRATTGSVENLRVTWTTAEGKPVSPLSPEWHDTTLFMDSIFTTTGIFEPSDVPATVTISGMDANGRPFSVPVNIPFNDKTWHGRAIAQVAAREIIDQIEHRTPNPRDAERLILPLALRFSLATAYTSFVAVVDQSLDVENQRAEKQRAVGYGPGTAQEVHHGKARSGPRGRDHRKRKSGEDESKRASPDRQEIEREKAKATAAQYGREAKKEYESKSNQRASEASEMEEKAEVSFGNESVQKTASSISMLVSTSGTWSADDTLARLLGVPFAELQAWAAATCPDNPNLCVTALTIAWFKKNGLDKDDRFILILTKARKALGNDENLIARAAAYKV